MIIASNKDRELAIKALNGLNSQDKNQILEAIGIVNTLLHTLVNSAAIYGDLQAAKSVQMGNSYSRPFLEKTTNRALFCTGSVTGDLLAAIQDFCLASNPKLSVYGNELDDDEEDDEEDEDDYEDDEEEEDEPF